MLSGSAGVTRFSELFQKLAGEAQDRARKWFWVTVVLASATLAAAAALPVMLLLGVRVELSGPEQYSLLGSKILIVSLLFGATRWASRNHRTWEHQQALNRYKDTALRTFEAFAEASSTPESRDVVLREGARCVFAPHPTGFVTGRDEDGPMNSFEIIQSAVKAEK